MTYLTIPHPIRSLTPAMMADARAVQTVLGGQWTTPEALRPREISRRASGAGRRRDRRPGQADGGRQ